MVLARRVVKADLRAEASAWAVLVWAYADECVRAAGEEYRDSGPVRETSSTGRLMNMGLVQGRGSINGRLDAHADALAIDKKLRLWFDFNPNYYAGVAMAAEKRRRVPMGCELPPLRVVPHRRVNGAIKEEYTRMGRHDKPAYCLFDLEGCSGEEMAAAQQVYDLFIAFLDIMPGLKLSKWRVTQRGIDSSGRIIDKGSFNRQK